LIDSGYGASNVDIKKMEEVCRNVLIKIYCGILDFLSNKDKTVHLYKRALLF